MSTTLRRRLAAGGLSPIPHRTVAASSSNGTGIWSLIGLLAILGYIVYRMHGLSYLQDFPALFQGRALDLTTHSADVFPTTITVIFLDVICSFAALVLVGIIGGMKMNGDHAVGKMLANLKVDNHFLNFFILVVIEEVLARWLCPSIKKHRRFALDR